MIKLLFLFGSAFLVGFSGAMMPGPMLTATISEVIKRGFKAGPLIVLGHAILEMMILAAVALGLAQWITLPVVKGCLGIGGGILLGIMGIQMSITARTAVEQAMHTQADPSKAIRGPIVTGILTSLSNPYWTIWWATTGLYYASLALESGLPGLGSFYLGHISSDLVWYGLVAIAIASGRKICPPRIYYLLITVCGIALTGLGLMFCYHGIRTLTG